MAEPDDRDTTADLPSSELRTTAEGRRSSPRIPAPRSSRYEVIDSIGRGGMGEVLLARDRVLGREVALKRLLDGDPSSQLESRFVREARVQSKLDHPSIPPVYELGTDDAGRPFIVMKRLAGTVLSDVIAKPSEAFSRERLLRAFVGVCFAVEYAHARGVIHRDLKPANIMIGEFGEVYVLDWGVAKLVEDSDVEVDGLVRDDDTTQVGAVIGTPAYMPPEQKEAGRGDLDARSDVFALGCVLYEILARRAFYKRGNRDERRPSREAPDRDIPPELDLACADATHHDRGERLASARELADRVQRYLDGDRDLAVRRELAREHLGAARGKLGARDEASRAVALREAGRALALDPSLVEAADIVHRVTVEPPAEIPPEVEARVAATNARRAAEHGRRVIAANCTHFATAAIFVAIGVRDLAYIVAYVVLASVLALFAFFAWKELLPSNVRRTVVVVGNALIVALFTQIISPIIVTPMVAMLVVFLALRSPAFHGRWAFYVVATQTLALIVPFALQLAGVIAPSISIVGNDIRLHSSVLEMRELPTLLALIVTTAVVPVFTAALALGHETARLAHDRLLQLQTWRLEQLVPDAQPS
ncbi:MAG TPA: serine/threonine-protein kinase [Kofleriaceae bacterium]|jgi:serine/threonine-protein kinase